MLKSRHWPVWSKLLNRSSLNLSRCSLRFPASFSKVRRDHASFSVYWRQEKICFPKVRFWKQRRKLTRVAGAPEHIYEENLPDALRQKSPDTGHDCSSSDGKMRWVVSWPQRVAVSLGQSSWTVSIKFELCSVWLPTRCKGPQEVYHLHVHRVWYQWAGGHQVQKAQAFEIKAPSGYRVARALKIMQKILFQKYLVQMPETSNVWKSPGSVISISLSGFISCKVCLVSILLFRCFTPERAELISRWSWFSPFFWTNFHFLRWLLLAFCLNNWIRYPRTS